MSPSRIQPWLDGSVEWTWPGERIAPGHAASVELHPPSWVPAAPLRAEPALSGSVGGRARTPAGSPSSGALARRRASGAALLALMAACVALAIDGRSEVERLIAGAGAAPAAVASHAALPAPAPPTPTLASVSHDASGSAIDSAAFSSPALGGEGSFLVYLPPGFARTSARYPVIYLLHGTGETDGSFLEIGLQGTLDRLIAEHRIGPVIAVMIQGGSGTNNWLNSAGGPHYESYVLEVQRLVDRMLPTVPARAARAIAGYSMGGFGAMHIALAHPRRFAVAESWLGFFNGLEGLLRADRQTISRLGLHAFVYGGASDDIADPSENAPFAAALRADGASAHSAVYEGEHSLATLEDHLEGMLQYAGSSLSDDGPSSAAPAARGTHSG